MHGPVRALTCLASILLNRIAYRRPSRVQFLARFAGADMLKELTRQGIYKRVAGDIVWQ